MKNKENFFLISFVVGVSVLLRFYNFFEIPYTHDELSALSRLEFNTFGDLIEKGVKPDGHPALIHVFLFYWTKIVGTSEPLVKLPFILLGIGCVFLVFKITEKRFNQTSAVFASLFIACSQFFIIYSQYARPYITGSFFFLGLIFYLFKVLFDEEIKLGDWILLSLFFLLCSLNHHVSMLAAFLSGLTGIFFLEKRRIIRYLIACLISCALYLIHLPITLSQIKIGGVGGWLAPPDKDFILKFFFFLFHYSWLPILAIVMLLIFSLFCGNSLFKRENHLRVRIYIILNFLLLWIICQLYSMYKNPILQYSSLIFTSPLLIIFVFSFIKELKGIRIWLPVCFLTGVMIYTLATNRKFFLLNYHQGFERSVEMIKFFEGKNSKKNKVAAVVRAEPWFINFYKMKFDVDFPVLYQPNERQLNFEELENFIDSIKPDVLMCLNLEPQLLAFSNAKGYSVIQKEIGYSYEAYLFNKTSTVPDFFYEDECRKKLTLKFDSVDTSFLYNKKKIISDSIFKRKKFLQVDSGDVYPLAFKMKLDKVNFRQGDHILMGISAEGMKGLLFYNVTKSDSSIFYTHTDYSKISSRRFNYSSMFYGFRSEVDDFVLTAGVQNHSKLSFRIYGFDLFIMNSNPYRYGLLEKIN